MTNSCGARCSISVLWSAQNRYSPIVYSSGWLPGSAGAGGVCARSRHVGGESWAWRWFAGGLLHFVFATPFAQLDTLVTAIFWGAVRFVLVDKHSYIQVMSFSFSLLMCRCCIRFRQSYFLWRGNHGRARCCCSSALPNSFQSWLCSGAMLLGHLGLFTPIAVFSPGFSRR